jgi:hypothetical protein
MIARKITTLRLNMAVYRVAIKGEEILTKYLVASNRRLKSLTILLLAPASIKEPRSLAKKEQISI